MKSFAHPSSARGRVRWPVGRPAWAAALPALLLALVLVLTGCGGGVGTGGTGSFAAGPVTGFGSVIVNDIVFDDEQAVVEDGEGTPRQRQELRLGMTVEIDAGPVQGGGARASRVRFDSALVGPVAAVDRAAGSFTLLGQTVAVDDTTVFDPVLAGRLVPIVAGRLLEVYAVYDVERRRWRATRIEARLAAAVYRVRGVVEELDTAAQTLRVGDASFSYAGAAGAADALAVGRPARLLLRTQPLPDGRWQVLAYAAALRELDDRDTVVVRGLVTAAPALARLRVDGRLVDASAAQLPDGAPLPGQRVEVQGRMRAGVLQATLVRLRSDQTERERGFDLRGPIESVDAAAGSFVLRGLTVGSSRPDLRFEGGSAADLAAGRRVDVRAQLAADGARLEATRIRFE